MNNKGDFSDTDEEWESKLVEIAKEVEEAYEKEKVRFILL